MMRARTTLLPALTATVLLLAASQAASAEPDLAKPTPKQAPWQDLEIGMFIHGQRVRAYVVEALSNKTWCEIARGISIGHKKIDRFEPTEVSKLRFRCTKSAAIPVIRKFAAYNTTVSMN